MRVRVCLRMCAVCVCVRMCAVCCVCAAGLCLYAVGALRVSAPRPLAHRHRRRRRDCPKARLKAENRPTYKPPTGTNPAPCPLPHCPTALPLPLHCLCTALPTHCEEGRPVLKVSARGEGLNPGRVCSGRVLAARPGLPLEAAGHRSPRARLLIPLPRHHSFRFGQASGLCMTAGGGARGGAGAGAGG